MLSTLYALVSLICYALDDYPSHKYCNDERYQQYGSKRFWKFDRCMFYVATANAVVCVLLILLKCVGIIEWW